MEFPGRVCVITGAASGLGRALALQLALRGCSVAICDVDERGLEQTKMLIIGQGGTVVASAVDVGDRLAVQRFAEQVIGEFGQVDVLFNNAGVTVQQMMADMDYADAEWLMRVNFWGVWHGSMAFLPHILASRGAIVNISSALGLVGYPSQVAYSASKFAIRGFTESLRHEVGDDILVCCVFLGSVKTNIFRRARFYIDETGNMDQEKAVANFEQLALLSSEEAARRIVEAVGKGKVRVLVGLDTRFFDYIQRIFPVRHAIIVRFIVRMMRAR